jgi:hypothetical protein
LGYGGAREQDRVAIACNSIRLRMHGVAAGPRSPRAAGFRTHSQKRVRAWPPRSGTSASVTGQEKTRAIMSALGKMWKELPTASKKPYEDAAQKEKSAYLKKFPDGPPPRVRLLAPPSPPCTQPHAFFFSVRVCCHPRAGAHLTLSLTLTHTHTQTHVNCNSTDVFH